MDPAALRRVCESIPNWWALNASDLERLAEPVLGRRHGGWVRRGAERVIVAKSKYGAAAAMLPEELAALGRDAQRLRGSRGFSGAVKACAYFHVRFENVHPLSDGNGRVGRIIMTGQLYQSFQVSPALLEQLLVVRQLDYRRAFAAATSEETCRQLTILLGEIVQVKITDPMLPPEFSLEPLPKSPDAPNAHAKR